MAEQAKRFRVGDPVLPETEIGPLIRPAENDRVAAWVDEAKAAGAEVLCGGNKISDTCYECTIIWDPPADAKVTTCETFGPVICVYPYSDIDEAISRANSLDVSFQAAVDWMPFAGLKHSGLGVGGIPHTMQDMQVEKMMVIKSDEL